ncbi:MAG: OB-fold nucleic acid binding domain-containing protein [Bacillota bacterium]
MERRVKQLQEARRAKVETLRQAGVDPFGPRFPDRRLAGDLLTDFAELAAEELESTAPVVRVAGRVISLRPHGRAGFAHLQDGTGRIQLYLRRDDVDEHSGLIWSQLDLGDIAGAEGALMRTRTGELTVRVHRLTMLTKALRPLPDKHGGLRDLEERYRSRHLDLLVNPGSRGVFEARSRILSALRRTLEGEGFLEAETPVLLSQAYQAYAGCRDMMHLTERLVQAAALAARGAVRAVRRRAPGSAHLCGGPSG